MSSTAGTAIGVFIVAGVAAFVAVSGTGGRRGHPGGGAAAVAETIAPLELVALEDDRDGDRFIVRGIVRNPATVEVDGLIAAVSVFGRDGGLMSSADAAVSASRLRAGAATPFVVIVPVAAEIDRYHLSFRTAAGLVPHLDRRVAGTPAGLA